MPKIKNIIIYLDRDLKMLGKFVCANQSMNIVGIVCKHNLDDIETQCKNLNIRLFRDDSRLHHFAKLSKTKALVILDHGLKPSKNVIENNQTYKIINCVPSNRVSDAGCENIYKMQLDRAGEYNYNYCGIMIYNYMNNASYYNNQFPIFKGKDTPEKIKERIDSYQYKFYPSIVEQVLSGTRR